MDELLAHVAEVCEGKTSPLHTKCGYFTVMKPIHFKSLCHIMIVCRWVNENTCIMVLGNINSWLQTSGLNFDHCTSWHTIRLTIDKRNRRQKSWVMSQLKITLVWSLNLLSPGPGCLIRLQDFTYWLFNAEHFHLSLVLVHICNYQNTTHSYHGDAPIFQLWNKLVCQVGLLLNTSADLDC